MPITTRTGVLLLTVDFAGVSSMDSLEFLLALLKRERLAATFASTDPAECPLAAAACSARGSHELSLLVETPCEDANFSREFAARVSAARTAGLPLSTVSVGAGSTQIRWDLVARQGMTAVLAGNTALSRPIGLRPAWRAFAERVIRRSSTVAPPQAIRYGLWQFPRHAKLAAARDGERAIRIVERVVREASLAVIAVDLGSLATGRGGLRAIEGLLTYAASRRAEGCLTVETAATAVRRLAATRCAVPARSILRARAA